MGGLDDSFQVLDNHNEAAQHKAKRNKQDKGHRTTVRTIFSDTLYIMDTLSKLQDRYIKSFSDHKKTFCKPKTTFSTGTLVYNI